jgi:hypothetical protein
VATPAEKTAACHTGTPVAPKVFTMLTGEP